MKGAPRWLAIALVCAWKLILFLTTAQPIPANDSFFYDGAVVNRILHGGYFNPSLAIAFPISGAKIFSAYPPFYQGVLLLWMKACGTSVISAMAFHMASFGIYALILCAILKRLDIPAWCANLASCFLLVITFQDRPDGLAHVCGMAAIYCWIRSWPGERSEPANMGWVWGMALFVVFGLATSLQIGAIYAGLIGVGVLLAAMRGLSRFPTGAVAAMVIIPAGLIALVRFHYPLLWAGFVEHASQTPSLTGPGAPSLGDLLKIGRNIPGELIVSAFVPFLGLKLFGPARERLEIEVLLLATLAGAWVLILACLLIVTPNTIGNGAYLQPLIVACFLTLAAKRFDGNLLQRVCVALLVLGIGLGAVRAIGMSTWGVACARDVGYSEAMQRIDSELKTAPAGSTVVLSSAFLYEGARHDNVRRIHSDWLRKARRGGPDFGAKEIVAAHPSIMIVTQFDYYRRFKPLLEKVKSDARVRGVEIENTAHLAPPDAYPKWERVVQHISWAPVVVKFSWVAEAK